MNLLAIDPGSHETGLAFFINDKLRWTGVFKGGKFESWQDRISTIADEISDLDFGDHYVNVIAMEKVVVGRNSNVAVTMGMTNGYLARVLEVIWPHASWIEVPKSEICSELGIKGNAKRKVRQVAARERFERLTQDENDAAAVGAAAIQMIKNG